MLPGNTPYRIPTAFRTAPWVVHAHSSTKRFDWMTAAFTLTVPMVKVLFEEIAKPSRLAALDLMPVLERTAEALNRVDQKAFFKSFDYGDAVQHFYEPFLQAYDPALRKNLGVWYTPKEIVEYMVERVDRVLRTELGRPNGLADKDVYVLDPCCGTGAYVVTVLRKIEDTLRQQGQDALLADDIKQAAKERIFGFELMSAPYVIAHWQVGNYLTQLGAPLDAKHGERAAKASCLATGMLFLRLCLHIVFGWFDFGAVKYGAGASDMNFFVFNDPGAIGRDEFGRRDGPAFADASASALFYVDRVFPVAGRA